MIRGIIAGHLAHARRKFSATQGNYSTSAGGDMISSKGGINKCQISKIGLLMLMFFIGATSACEGPHDGRLAQHLAEDNYEAGWSFYNGSAFEPAEKAVKAFSLAIQYDQDFVLAYCMRGYAYGNLGKYRLAFQDFDRGIELDSGVAVCHNNRADTLIKLKQYGQALEAANRAVGLRPGMGVYFMTRGEAREGRGDMAKACQDFGSACGLGFKPACNELNEKKSCVKTLKDLTVAKGLLKAAATGNVEAIRKAVQAGPILAVKNKSGRTPLMIAVYNGHAKAARLLLESGANVHVQDNQRRTALIEAAFNGNTETLQLLIRHGAKLNGKDKRGATALIIAASKGHPGAVDLLLKSGADINLRDQWGQPAVFLALSNGKHEAAKMLIEKGANLEIRANNGVTVLIAAANGGNLDIVRRLIENGADVNTKSEGGYTALIGAAQGGHLDVAKLLIRSGADLKARTVEGDTAAITATIKGHEQMVQLLEAAQSKQ